MNINRFFQVIKWNVLTYKKTLIRQLVLPCIPFFFVAVPNFLNAIFGHEVLYNDVNKTALTYETISCFMLVYWASRVCFNVETKSSFVTYAMLPATMLEKFAANVFFQTVIKCVGLVCSVVLVDVLFMLVSLVFAGNVVSLTMCTMQNLVEIPRAFSVDVVTAEVVDNISGTLFVHSLFVLGGCFFRKHHFLYTMLILMFGSAILMSALGFVAAGSVMYLSESGYEVTINPLFSDSVNQMISMLAVLLLAIFNYWMAFRFFCRSQLINNRFFN